MAAAEPAARTTIYHATPAWRRPAAIATAVGAVLVAGAAAFAASALLAGGGGSREASTAQLPVVVFNATPTPGAAHRIAEQLGASHVRVARVGDINASLGHGTFVLYPPSAQRQARALARLLASPAPTVEPIQPQVQEAIGHLHEIVVVFD